MTKKKVKPAQHDMGFELFRQAEEAAPKCFICSRGVNNPYHVNGERKDKAFDGFYIHQVIGGDYVTDHRLKWVHIDCAREMIVTLFGYLAQFGQQVAELAGQVAKGGSDDA